MNGAPIGGNGALGGHDRRDSVDPEVRFSRSNDGGQSWLASDVRLDTPSLGAGASGAPQIVCDGLDVAVAWQDARNGLPDIYLNTSTNGGDTWRRDSTRIGSGEPGAARSTKPSFIREGESTYLTWQDDRDGSDDIYFLEPDLTAPPLEEYRLDTDPPGSATWVFHQVCADGSNVGVVWQDNRFVSPAIYFRGSTSAGVNWSGWDIRLHTDTVGESKWLPQICCGNGNVYAVWMAIGQSSADVYFNRSTDGGQTWLADEMRIGSDAPGSGSPSGRRLPARATTSTSSGRTTGTAPPTSTSAARSMPGARGCPPTFASTPMFRAPRSPDFPRSVWWEATSPWRGRTNEAV